MLRVIHVYDRGAGQLSFAPDRPDDRPVVSVLVHQVGTRISGSEVRLGRWPANPFSPDSLVLAARARWFRLRVYRDRLAPKGGEGRKRGGA